jgi:hypothetical protein
MGLLLALDRSFSVEEGNHIGDKFGLGRKQ